MEWTFYNKIITNKF